MVTRIEEQQIGMEQAAAERDEFALALWANLDEGKVGALIDAVVDIAHAAVGSALAESERMRDRSPRAAHAVRPSATGADGVEIRRGDKAWFGSDPERTLIVIDAAEFLCAETHRIVRLEDGDAVFSRRDRAREWRRSAAAAQQDHSLSLQPRRSCGCHANGCAGAATPRAPQDAAAEPVLPFGGRP
jgi:hypothetical protein